MATTSPLPGPIERGIQHMIKDIEITAPGKLIALILVLLGCFAYIIVAALTGAGDTTPAWATLTLVVGYLVGNGVGARNGITTVAPMGPKGTDQQ